MRCCGRPSTCRAGSTTSFTATKSPAVRVRRDSCRPFSWRAPSGRQNYVKRSTAFLFAEYLGWVEIFRRDLQFLDLGDSQTNRQIMFLLHKISGTLNAANTSDAECFRIFRADQRALGELMIEADSKPGERRCLGYAAFCSVLAAGGASGEWGRELLDHVELAAHEPDMARDRLTRLQHQLIDLVDLLDPRGQRFLSEQRSRFAPTE